MTIRLNTRHLAAGMAAAVAIGLLLSGVAYAVTGNIFRYSTPRTGSLNINEIALRPDSGGRTFTTDHGFLAGNGCFQTGVFLPHGARLTRLTVWHVATVANGVQFLLYRESSKTGSRQTIVYKPSTDTSGNRVAKVFPLIGPLALIDNNAFSYGFTVCLAPNAAFASARLTYTYRNAGD